MCKYTFLVQLLKFTVEINLFAKFPININISDYLLEKVKNILD